MKTKAHNPTNAVDQRVASRIRHGRIVRGLTQRQLGDAIGVSSSQMHKIEKGLNQVSAGFLYRIADVLDVPIVYFYQDIGTMHLASKRIRMVTELMLNFSSIDSDKQRDAFSQLVRVLAVQTPRKALPSEPAVVEGSGMGCKTDH